jgi:hypothetical protein
MTKLCARGKSAAKRKFKVYPSAYANAYASKICAGKIKDPSGTKRKDWGPKKAFLGGLFKKKEENIFKKRKQDQRTKQQRLEELKKEMGMSKGGEMDYGKQKKDKMKTKPYGIEDRKIKTEKLLSQKDVETLKKQKGIGLYARPEKNTSAGKTAPPRYSVGGGADMSTIKKKKKKPAPGGGRERHEYMKNIQNPISEYSPDRKLKYTGAKVGMNVTAGGQSAMGRLQKSGMLRAYTGRAVRQPTETEKEFEMRHEYHTPFKKPQKAKGGGIAIKGTKFKGVF